MSDVVCIDKVQQNEYGKGNVLGLEVQFSKMLGDVVVEQYLKELKEEDIKLITDYMTQDLFDYREKRDYDGKTYVQKIVKEDWETRGEHAWHSETHKSVGTQIKEMFNARFKEKLQKKIEEIIKSDEYQKKVDDIAHEIIDYSINGYKEDLMNSIREKLIGNVMNNGQYYGGIYLKDAIHQVVSEYIH